MSGVHVHLLLNHVPILGTLFALALLAYGAWRGSRDLLRVSWTAFVALWLIAIPVFKSGEPAEDAVAKRPEVSQQLIDDHEHLAKRAMASNTLLVAVSVVALWSTRGGRTAPGWLLGASLLAAAVTFGLMAGTGNLGGQIRHAEVRPGAASNQPPTAETDR